MERLTRSDYGEEQLLYACDNCIRGLGVDNPPCAVCDHENAALEKLAAYEDTGLTPEEILYLKDEIDGIRASVDQLYADQKFVKMLEAKGKIDVDGTLDHVNDLLEAEEQGRLVVLPCKSGDTIYQLRGKKHARGKGVSPRIVSCATVWSDGDYELHHQGQTPCSKKDFNKTWFLTREEAEAALAAQKEEGR